MLQEKWPQSMIKRTKTLKRSSSISKNSEFRVVTSLSIRNAILRLVQDQERPHPDKDIYEFFLVLARQGLLPKEFKDAYQYGLDKAADRRLKSIDK